MSNIKGPRSALSEFIKQHNIKTTKKKESEITVDAKEDKREASAIIKKKTKKAKLSKSFEISTSESKQMSLKDICIMRICASTDKYDLQDKHRYMISQFLSKHRMFNLPFFTYLLQNAQQELVVHDCSMIKDEDYVISNVNITKLELHQCGQLSNYRLNELLRNFEHLKVLRITGAYLVTSITLPIGLDVIDLSNCNRLNNTVITELNKKYKKLEELRLSYCYKIKSTDILKADVKKLYLDETLVTEKFYKRKKLEELSIQKCPNINTLTGVYPSLYYVFLLGISTIEYVKFNKKIKSLNVSKCYKLTNFLYENLGTNFCDIESLDISYLDFVDYDFLFKLKNLKFLNISWCGGIDDKLVTSIIHATHVETIHVFGCFSLSQKIAEFSYEVRNRIKIVGNPSETKYLIQKV